MQYLWAKPLSFISLYESCISFLHQRNELRYLITCPNWCTGKGQENKWRCWPEHVSIWGRPCISKSAFISRQTVPTSEAPRPPPKPDVSNHVNEWTFDGRLCQPPSFSHPTQNSDCSKSQGSLHYLMQRIFLCFTWNLNISFEIKNRKSQVTAEGALASAILLTCQPLKEEGLCSFFLGSWGWLWTYIPGWGYLLLFHRFHPLPNFPFLF